MKKSILFTLAALATALSLVSCKPDPTLETSRNSIEADSDGLQCNVEIKANYPWSAIASSDWIILNNTSCNGDGTISVYVAANTTNADRSGTITVKCDEGITRTISVSQSQNHALHPDGDESIISSLGGEIVIRLSTNVQYEVLLSEDATWIESLGTRSLESFDHIFNIAENEIEEQRSATVTFRNEALGIEKQYLITQEAHTPTLYITHELEEITAPALTGDGYRATIDWGDGCTEAYRPDASHRYAVAGEYRITIYGQKITGCDCATLKGVKDIDFSNI